MNRKLSLEVEGVAGKHRVTEAARLVGAASATLWFHLNRGADVSGEWFTVHGKRLRVLIPDAPRGEMLKTAGSGGDRGKLQAALERGQKFTTAGDVRAAMGWLSRTRRLAEDLKLVMAGKADLTVDYQGGIVVLHHVVHKPAEFTEPAPSTEYVGAEVGV